MAGSSSLRGAARTGRDSGRPRRRLLVALVLEGRVAAEVDGLRRALQPGLVERLPPHVTLVPPVNVDEAVLPAALSLVKEAAGGCPPLRLDLGPVGTFLPRTPVVYLACGGDLEAVESLRIHLSRPPLAPPPTRPERPFVAHVTLTNRVDPSRAPAVVSTLAGFRAGTVVERVTVLDQDDRSRDHRWHPVADVELSGTSLHGRGGFEVEVTFSERLDPQGDAFVRREAPTSQSAGRSAPRPFAATARVDGALAAVVTGARRDDAVEIHCLLVAPELRHQGVGARLLGVVEGRAIAEDVRLLRARTDRGGALEAFLLARGFTAPDLPGIPGNDPSVLLVRPLP